MVLRLALPSGREGGVRGRARMKLIDYLGGFSVEDLRELARRRGIPLRQEALRDRQTLLRNLSASLGTYDAVHAALNGLNQAELGVLQVLLEQNPRGTQGSVAAALNAEPAEVRPVLDQLRLWGLAFPEGNWDHIGVPGSTQLISGYLATVRGSANGAATPLAPPALETVPSDGLQARSGSFGWDLAEFLARIARVRLKLTQAGRMNRRDLRGMESAFAVETEGYGALVYQLALALQLIEGSRAGTLRVSERADAFLARPEEPRARQVLETWVALRGYPESSSMDPADAEYIPPQTSRQRSGVLDGLREAEGAVTLASLAARLRWRVPRSFEQWEGNRSALVVAVRMVRSLFWLGLVRVDDLQNPTRAALTPLGQRMLTPNAPDVPGLIPEDPFFFLQPNAETFSPPNLAPRTLFHLRRISGEKKGGPAGIYPITQDSLRRALDTGLTAADVVQFLERFSRTGLPDNVRTLVETAGRQHGRIRLVPAGYVLVTEDATLLREIRSLKPVEPLLGPELTERSVALGEQDVTELLRRLRARGYSPLDETSTDQVPPLPDEAEVPPVEVSAGAAAPPEVELDWSHVEFNGTVPEPQEGQTPEGWVTDTGEIRALMELAETESLVVEIEYQSRAARVPTTRCIWPLYVDGYEVEAHCCLRDEERHFNLSRIRSARLTGESFQP